jgi:hypothetical protein
MPLLLLFLVFSQVFPGTFPLEPMMNPTTQHQVSDCRTFLIMCVVPSTAVFRRESIECFPGIFSRYLFSPLVRIPVAPMITDITGITFLSDG